MSDWRAVCPAAWQARVVESALEVLPGTPGLVAAWVGGSLAAGIADAFSDVDLNVAVEDDRMETWRSSWASVVEACAGPLVLAQAIGGLVAGGFALTRAWEHVDLVVHPRSGVARPEPCRILVDPHGLLTESPSPATPGDPFYPGDDVTLFLYLLGNLVVTLGRGELVVAHGGVGALRDLLVRVMLAENGVHRADGQKRLNPYLTAEQRAVLEALPTPPVDQDAILRTCRDLYLQLATRARRLAPATGSVYPDDLAAATDEHLHRAFGERWPS